MPSDKRPLSPHLFIYKPQITSVLSITHRITGVALYVGTMVLVAWLWTLAYAPEKHLSLLECLHSPVGQSLLVGWTFAFYYHLANGIRHLFWDAGMGFSIPAVHKSGWMVILFTVAMTALTWNCIYSNAGQ